MPAWDLAPRQPEPTEAVEAPQKLTMDHDAETLHTPTVKHLLSCDTATLCNLTLYARQEEIKNNGAFGQRAAV